MAERKKKDIRLDIEPDGKWKLKGGFNVPKKGTGAPNTGYCEACGNSRIRYMFVLEHPEYGTVRCGRNCAGKLLSGRDAKVLDDKQALVDAMRREVFMEQIWRVNTEKQTWFLRFEGTAITIIRSKYGDGFGILMGDRASAVWRRNGKPIETLDAAKETAFDIILAAERRARKRTTRRGGDF